MRSSAKNYVMFLGIVASLLQIVQVIWFDLSDVTKDTNRQLKTAGGSINSQQTHDNDATRSSAEEPLSDGTFNGLDLHYVDHPPASRIHCVGENWERDRSYLYRSCEYANLCFDIDEKRLVAFVDSPISPAWDSSTEIYGETANVLAGSQQKDWFQFYDSDTDSASDDRSRPKHWFQFYDSENGSGDEENSDSGSDDNSVTRAAIGRYRPKIYTNKAAWTRPSSYYRVNATLIPFYRHGASYRNPGHLLWDDFLPIYTLLDIFDRVDDCLWLLHMIRPTVGEKGSKHFEEEFHEEHDDLIHKFLPLLTGQSRHYQKTLKKFSLKFQKNKTPRWRQGERRLVCADYGVMGDGLFSDHGEHNWHGQASHDFFNPHNCGRGGSFRRFRSWMIGNLGLPSTTNGRNKPPPRPYLILVSQKSSSGRNSMSRQGIEFVDLTRALNSALGTTADRPRADVQTIVFSNMSLTEQVSLTSKATVVISTVGGGSSTAFFLPKGASLFLFYDLAEDVLDWDLWNNFADINVHWIPLGDRTGENHVEKLTALVTKELDYLDSLHDDGRSYHGKFSKNHHRPKQNEPKIATTSDNAEEKRIIPSSSNATAINETLSFCDSYNGVLFISHVLATAGVGTLFFQSIVDSLLYAEEYGLYPWVHVNYDNNEPCYDANFHGVGPIKTLSRVFGGITDWPRDGDMYCDHGVQVGPPDYANLTRKTFTLVGNGLWDSYFEPTRPSPIHDRSCQRKPIFEMSYSQVYSGMHYCSDFAVRGWRYWGLPKAATPNGRPIHEWLWDSRSKASRIVDKYFRLKPVWQAKVERANPNPRRCLAMHVRLTDKASGRDKKGLSHYTPYAESFARQMDELGDDSPIYIATDDATVFDTIQREWSRSARSRVIAQDGVKRADGGNTPTFELLENDKHRSNIEALVDIYAMARCSYFVQGFSGMAEAAVYINPALHNRSANVDDPDTLSAEDFQRMVAMTEQEKATK